MRWIYRLLRLGFVLGMLLVWYGWSSVAVTAWRTDVVSADAALVLGAAAWGDRPSPVFRERINHAIQLYREGAVQKIVFTGGVGIKSPMAEAVIAQQYAIQRGVPVSDILIEDQSRNTLSNLTNAAPILAANDIESVILVSTPFHMRRALLIANALDLNAYLSPTRTTEWRGSRPYFFTREVAAFLYYRFLW
jgi:uncharacterized SAM-binding protein YcdF (DUF218 family)